MYEDDVVVLEIQPGTRAQDEEGQINETEAVGYIKGEPNLCFVPFTKYSYNNSFTHNMIQKRNCSRMGPPMILFYSHCMSL